MGGSKNVFNQAWNWNKEMMTSVATLNGNRLGEQMHHTFVGPSARDEQNRQDAANRRDAENLAAKQSGDQALAAEKLRIETLQQPKKITPDNFMARKSKQLAQLRLGMNSTMTGAGNPTLQPAPAALKNKMGA